MRFLLGYPKRVLVETLKEMVGPSSPHFFASGSLQVCSVNWTTALIVQNKMQHSPLQSGLRVWAKECCGDLNRSCCNFCSCWLSCTQVCRELIHSDQQIVISFPFFWWADFLLWQPLTWLPLRSDEPWCRSSGSGARGWAQRGAAERSLAWFYRWGELIPDCCPAASQACRLCPSWLLRELCVDYVTYLANKGIYSE